MLLEKRLVLGLQLEAEMVVPKDFREILMAEAEAEVIMIVSQVVWVRMAHYLLLTRLRRIF
jgi:hypothetical protein